MNTTFNMPFADAPQRAFSFALNQAFRVEREVYALRYRDIQYPDLVPVDTTGPEWIGGVTYYSSDAVGQAKWFAGKADDVPHAEVMREKFEMAVHMAAIGYDWDLEEIGKAQLLGVDLRIDKAAAARRAAEEFIDKVAITGDSTKGFTGLANNAAVTAGNVAATGTGSTTTWSTKTPLNILADINAAITGTYSNTVGAELADTLIVPMTRYLDIAARPMQNTDGSQVGTNTVLEYVRMNNVYTALTGNPLTIRAVWGLETAGAASTPRMIAYRRAPDVLVLQMPMPFRFLPPWQQGPLRFEVPGIFRISGVDVRRPRAMRYADAI